jgi:cell division septal protein FtsQ
MSREPEPRARLTPTGPPTGGRVLPFRRGAVKPRRRRRGLAAALARGLASAVLIVGAPLALAGWALTSPRFALTELEVTGSDRVPAAWVRARLAPLVGRNLLLLPLSAVDRALAGHPWIGDLAVAKALPSRLAVAVTTRRPAALVLADGVPWYADAAGDAIAPLDGEEAPGLLLVTRGDGVEAEGGGVPLALAVAEELAAAAPAWARELTRIDVLSAEDARLHTAALPCPLLVRGGQIGARAGRLSALLPEVATRYPELVALDLRFARRIVVQPAEPSTGEPGEGDEA